MQEVIMLIHYIKIAFRNLWKYKVQNLIGIIGLAVGFVCFSLCSYLTQQYFTTDTEHPGAARMYKLSTEYGSVFSGDIYARLKEFSEIEKISIVESNIGGMLSFDDEKLPQSTFMYLLQVDTCFIDFFSLKALAGNPHSMNRTINGIVLFENKAKELCDNFNELIGKTAKLFDDETEYQIAGVVKQPRNSNIMNFRHNGFVVKKSDSYLQYEIYATWDPQKVGQTFLLLSPESSFSVFQKRLQLTDFGFKIDPYRLGSKILENGDLERIKAEDKDEHFTLLPINKIDKRDNTTKTNIGIFVIGLLVFLMALFNYMSFQTALFYNRLKECAIRKVTGSGKAQIFFLFFCEILIAFMLMFLIAFPVLQEMLPLLTKTPVFIGIQLESLNIYMIQYLLFVILLSAIFCLIPVFTINKLSIRIVFLGLSVKGKKVIWRNGLLFVQMIILLIFISAGSIVSIQTYRLKSDLLENVPKEEQKRIFYTTVQKENLRPVMQQLSSSPIFEDIICGYDNVISTIGGSKQFTFLINGDEQRRWIELRPVPAGFFKFFHCQLIKGQYFNENSAPNDIVVDKTFSDLFISKEVVGEIIDNYRVVGVINTLEVETKKSKLSKTKNPVFYLNQEVEKDIYRYVIYVKSAKGNEKEALEFMKNTLTKILPIHPPITTRLLKDEIDDVLTSENTLFRSLVALFVISLIIGLLSIYSAVTMNSEKRRKEVAIRKIYGAELSDIILLFFRKYLIMWTIVCIVVFPAIYYYANNWLESYVTRISLNIFLFIGIFLAVLILIMLTIISQILNVSRTHPAEIIKSEYIMLKHYVKITFRSLWKYKGQNTISIIELSVNFLPFIFEFSFSNNKK